MGVAEQLHVDVTHASDRVILTLTGELDMASAPMLQGAVEDAHLDAAELVVVDLKGLEFVDSTGLRVILALHKLCAERGQELAVTQGSQQVQRLLSVTGVADHLKIISSPDAPLA